MRNDTVLGKRRRPVACERALRRLNVCRTSSFQHLLDVGTQRVIGSAVVVTVVVVLGIVVVVVVAVVVVAVGGVEVGGWVGVEVGGWVGAVVGVGVGAGVGYGVGAEGCAGFDLPLPSASSSVVALSSSLSRRRRVG